MPISNTVLIPYVVSHMGAVSPLPRSILDIGPGAGWYACLFRGLFETRPWMSCVEAIPEYVAMFNLRGVYDEVHVNDVMLADDELLNSCDAVFMGDVIEHLTLLDGHLLLGRIRKPVIIATPVEFFHNGPGLPWSETHRSLWTEKEFAATGRVQRHDTIHGGHVVTLRGISPG